MNNHFIDFVKNKRIKRKIGISLYAMKKVKTEHLTSNLQLLYTKRSILLHKFFLSLSSFQKYFSILYFYNQKNEIVFQKILLEIRSWKKISNKTFCTPFAVGPDLFTSKPFFCKNVMYFDSSFFFHDSFSKSILVYYIFIIKKMKIEFQ